MLQGVAFFDLDHTLLAHNSGILYAQAAYTQGRISFVDLVRSVGWGLAHRFGKLDVAEAYRRAGALFRGMVGEELRAEVQAWFHRDASRHLRPGGRRVLDMHVARGERTVLITNSSSFIAQAAVAAFGMHDYLANDILVDEQGLVTGATSTPLCYGPGKVHKAEAWARAHGLELGAACFYSDSISDLPLLERVRTPVAVHPDSRLRRVAHERGWPIELW